MQYITVHKIPLKFTWCKFAHMVLRLEVDSGMFGISLFDFIRRAEGNEH